MHKYCLPGALILSLLATTAGAEDIYVERLTWAGVKMVADDTTVFIDAIGTDLWGGNAPGGMIPLEADTRRRYALVTHVHNDHFDVDGLQSVLGDRGYVIAHESVATYIASRGLRVIPATLWEPVSRAGFVFTAVPATDGFGDTQVSWVVRFGNRRYIHGGDTVWHGWLENIGAQLGPFDAAFLPVNGARVGGPFGVETRRTMTPVNAVDAALQLRAALLVPIHYGGSNPPMYVEVEDPVQSLKTVAERRGMPMQVVEPGQPVFQQDRDSPERDSR